MNTTCSAGQSGRRRLTRYPTLALQDAIWENSESETTLSISHCICVYVLITYNLFFAARQGHID